MAHPHNALRDHKVQKSRVAHITKGYATGGAVHSDEAEDKKLIRKSVKKAALKVEGEKSKHRADRHKRAKGGRVKKGTVVNVIVPQHGAQPGGPPMAGPPPMPPHPPMGPPPGAMPPGGPPGMPPGGPPMMPHHKGGRVKRAYGGMLGTAPQTASPMASGMASGMPMNSLATAPPPAMGGVTGMQSAMGSNPLATMPPQNMYAKGGRVKSGPGWTESTKNMTKVQHDPGKLDGPDIGRKKPITYKTGGRIESPQGVASSTKLPAGAGGGEARLAKAHRAARG